MRRRIAVIVVAVSSSMPLTHAVGRGRTYVTHDCMRVAMQPRSIVFTCADDGFYMTQGEWARWHRHRAVGSALFHRNDCHPSCAAGTFHTTRGRIVLRHRERCPDLRRHRHVFTRATIRLDGELLGRNRYRVRLFCPV